VLVGGGLDAGRILAELGVTNRSDDVAAAHQLHLTY
jgi:hypothetical protein